MILPGQMIADDTDDIPFVDLMMSFDTSAYINKVVVGRQSEEFLGLSKSSCTGRDHPH